MAFEEPHLDEYDPMASSAVRAHACAGRRNTTTPRPPPIPRPLPQNVIDRGHRYGIAQRIQCLTLQAEGFS